MTHVVEAARAVADDVVVVSRGELVAPLRSILDPEIRVVRDDSRWRAPLVGLAAGADSLRTTFVAALACDLPLLRPAILSRLFAYAHRHDAAIPRWPDDLIEPLVAVYRRQSLLRGARAAIRANALANTDMIARLPRVRYVSMQTLRRDDPRLLSFTNVNTPADLARAGRL